MKQKNILFIDRDGTLIDEPPDQQVDSLEKLRFMPFVIPTLLKLQQVGYSLVMISNQDGLGTSSFPKDRFTAVQEFMLNTFKSQGITFDDILICPHFVEDNCNCRKPQVGLALNYLKEQIICREFSYVIGDRLTDMVLAQNLGIKGIQIGAKETPTWLEISQKILNGSRMVAVSRKTNETEINVEVNLDSPGIIHVNTGLGFFNHMLEQLAKHGGFSLSLSVIGDLHIDDHHTVEDTAIVLGEAIRKALGVKRGIARYGFLLPMDEALAQVSIDLCGRNYFVFNGQITRERIGDISTELIPHFFRSLSESLKATIHIDVKGENTHHMIESMFKAFGRSLRQAIAITDNDIPSTKGLL